MVRKYKANDNIFNKLDSHAKAYWLGFIAGDGCINPNKNYLDVRIHKKDIEVLENLKSFLEADNPITTHENTIILHISSKQLVKDIAFYGIGPNKTKNMNLNIDERYYNSFILGLFDADGCVNIYKKKYKDGYRSSIRFNLVGLTNVVGDIQNYLIENCGIKKNKLQNHHSTDYVKYLMYDGNKQVRKIYNLLYKDYKFSLARKKDKFINYFK